MTQLPSTRASLLLQLGQHDERAWGEFQRIYESAILRYCRAIGLQEADARDVTQDVLAAVHARIPTWDTDRNQGSFRAWLFRVARNLAADSIRARAKRMPTGSNSQLEQVLAGRDAWDRTVSIDTEYQRALFEWAARLVRTEVRDATWEAFQRTAVLSHTAEQVARELDLSLGNVYTAKCRVLARIRTKIAQIEGVLPDSDGVPTETRST